MLAVKEGRKQEGICGKRLAELKTAKAAKHRSADAIDNIPQIYLLINGTVAAKGINDIDLKEILKSIKP